MVVDDSSCLKIWRWRWRSRYLEIEVEDPVFLVLAWEMRAETQGVFKRSEVRDQVLEMIRL